MPALAASRPHAAVDLEGVGPRRDVGPRPAPAAGALVVVGSRAGRRADARRRPAAAQLRLGPLRRSRFPARPPADAADHGAADATRHPISGARSTPTCSAGSTRCRASSSVGGTTRLPLGSTNVSTKIVVEGRDTSRRPNGRKRNSAARFTTISRRWASRRCAAARSIRTMGPTAPPVVVINQTMARQMFRGEDPVGKRVQFGDGRRPWSTIVGVIGDVRHSGLEAPPAPEVYIYYLQNPPVNPFIVLRTSCAIPRRSFRRSARTLHAVDKDIAAYDIRPMTQVRAESVATAAVHRCCSSPRSVCWRWSWRRSAFIGVMALIVSERTAEIGIRLALGAQPAHVLRVIVLQGSALPHSASSSAWPRRPSCSRCWRPSSMGSAESIRQRWPASRRCCWPSPRSPATCRPGGRCASIRSKHCAQSDELSCFSRCSLLVARCSLLVARCS